MNEKKILLNHGSGGRMSHELIEKVFVKHFSNEILSSQTDAAILQTTTGKLAFTTDSYVVDPIFFPGGNIGKLAVCGTVNDLSVSGAKPAYLSAGFIIEEGFDMDLLEKIVSSMAEEAKKAGIKIVTGDTKIVNKGQCDKVFINTAGIGNLHPEKEAISYGKLAAPGDKIIINGSLGDHGIAILAARESLHFETPVLSDCQALNLMIGDVLESGTDVHFMRDATRGGLATVLNEVTEKNNLGIHLWEDALPVKDEVKGTCEIFGFDPLYLANEGKVVMIVKANDADKAISEMKKHEGGKEAAIIGEVTGNHPGKVVLNTSVGGSRIVDMLVGEQLPRIC